MTIRVEKLTCAYSGKPVFEELTFAVQPAEMFIIIGPNGSGKTTLIKALAGLRPVSGGEIKFHDRPLKQYKRKELARLIAYVSQSIVEDSPFTVQEMVLMGRSPYLGVLGVEGEADLTIARQAIDYAGLAHLADRPMTRLSGGERQRALIARAICQQPRLILLDEPTAALDMAHQVRMMEILAGLRTDHETTVVMVSHDINLAAMYADRLLLLVDGRIVACGPPEVVVDTQILTRAYDCPLRVDTSPVGPWPRVSLIRGNRPSTDTL
jgi:iron complex transport system ATP-binding protein